MVYQQIVGIPLGTNCYPLIADFFYVVIRGILGLTFTNRNSTTLQTCLTTLLDDIFTIYNPELEKHIPDIYSTELQLSKVNTSNKETSAFTTNAITLDFLSSIFLGWVVMFLDSHRLVFTFLSWLDLLGVALEFRISISHIFNLLPNY